MRITPLCLSLFLMLPLVAGCLNQSIEPPRNRSTTATVSTAKGAYSGLPLARPKVELPKPAPRVEPTEERTIQNEPVADTSAESLMEPLVWLDTAGPVNEAQSRRSDRPASGEEFSSAPRPVVSAPGDFPATTGSTVGPLASSGLPPATSARVYSPSRSDARSLELPSRAIAGPQRSLEASAATGEVDPLQSFLENPEAASVVAINGSGGLECPFAPPFPGDEKPRKASIWTNRFRCDPAGTIRTVTRNGEPVSFETLRCSFIQHDRCGGQADVILPMTTLNERSQGAFNRISNLTVCTNGSEFTLYQCNRYPAVPRAGTMAQFDYYLPVKTLEEGGYSTWKIVFPASDGMSPVYDLHVTLPEP